MSFSTRAFASTTALSLALVGGTAVAPAAGATEWTDSFQSCMNVADDLVKGGEKVDGFLDTKLADKGWKAYKLATDNNGSSAPGDSFSLCMEQALASKDPEKQGPAIDILIAIIAGSLGLAGALTSLLDQQGIINLPR